jgi:hypothetical protein
VSTSPADDLQKIPVETTALVSEPLELPSSEPGNVAMIEDRAGRICAAVEAPARQLLVVSESFDTGWQVCVDSQPVPLRRVNGDFFGCVVERGKHRVEFTFLPASLRVGRIVSLTALVIALSLGFGPTATAMLRRRSRSEAADIGKYVPPARSLEAA